MTFADNPAPVTRGLMKAEEWEEERLREERVFKEKRKQR